MYPCELSKNINKEKIFYLDAKNFNGYILFISFNFFVKTLFCTKNLNVIEYIHLDPFEDYDILEITNKNLKNKILKIFKKFLLKKELKNG